MLGSAVAIVISWVIWLMILFWVNPEAAGVPGYVLFFLSLFLAIASTMALVGYGVRRFVASQELPAYSVRYSLRQGLLLAILIDISLVLQRGRLLRWWLVLILIVLCVSIEFIFLSYDHARTRSVHSEN